MSVLTVAIVCGFVLAILLSVEVGYQWGIRRWRSVPRKERTFSSTMEASIFGLMGLLIAFVFYGAGSRFENRRNLVVQEANAIGTAYLRLDLLPSDTQPELREDFRKYVQARLAVYQKIPDVKAVNAALDQSAALQNNVWKKAIEATKQTGPAEKSLVLGSLNAMIDITTDRTVALSTHPPAAVFAMLAVAVIASSALAGYTMSVGGIRDWVPMIVYAFVVGTAMFVILDYEYPRAGVIRVDPVDKVLVQTLKRMN